MPQLSVHPNQRVPFEVVFEDAHLLVVYKPAGVVTQPGVGHDRNALLNGLFVNYGTRLQNLGKVRDYGLLHRLDKPTSGLVLVGLSREGYDGLRAQFEARTIEKTYVTLVHGMPRPAKGVVNGQIREVRIGGRKRAKVGPGPRAQKAVTRYATLSQSAKLSLVRCELETGRLHQIRAHMEFLKCPVVGDREYGKPRELDKVFGKATRKAIFLHAGAVGFKHPVSGQKMTHRVGLPATHLEFLKAQGVVCPKVWRR